jgi:hypothetical protein
MNVGPRLSYRRPPPAIEYLALTFDHDVGAAAIVPILKQKTLKIPETELALKWSVDRNFAGAFDLSFKSSFGGMHTSIEIVSA